MFGLSFGELMMVLLVAIVAIGPRDLPKVLRKLGQTAGKLRRTIAELRVQSGIDDVLRSEGLTDDIREIQRLARGELDHVVAATRANTFDQLHSPDPSPYASHSDAPPAAPEEHAGKPVRFEREFPVEGADHYGALPDTSMVYAGALAPSEFADDPIFTCGEKLPPEAEAFHERPTVLADSAAADPAQDSSIASQEQTTEHST